MTSWSTLRISICFIAAVAAGWLLAPQVPANSLVVYCAHDAEFAAQVLDRFTQKTGINVAVRFDTEATKSLGLVNQLLLERGQPRCDVFWNNQVLGTQLLEKQGILEPYVSPVAKRIPSEFRADDGSWTGFAARLRVYLVDPVTVVLPDDPQQATAAVEAEIERRLTAAAMHRVAIARPLFGTTHTHYATLWQRLGNESVASWNDRWRAAGVSELNSNGAVKNAVVSGACDIGLTDTDDAAVAIAAGAKLRIVPFRIQGRSICIPNSVAMIRGSRNREQAQQLVNFLLSEETEIELANSPARQIPLGPVAAEKIPADVQTFRTWSRPMTDVKPLIEVVEELQGWLKRTYLQ